MSIDGADGCKRLLGRPHMTDRPSSEAGPGDPAVSLSFGLHGEIEGIDRHSTLDVFHWKVHVPDLMFGRGTAANHGGDNRLPRVSDSSERRSHQLSARHVLFAFVRRS
jgi:hypothetical protein